MIEGIILGIVQGLAEFLPISSSAHLVVIPWILGWPDLGLSFDVALHIGTFIAIIIYFRKDWIKIIKAFLASIARKKIETVDEKLSWFIVVGSVPGALAGALLEHQVSTTFRNPLLIATTLTVFGLILLWQDKVSKKQLEVKNLGWKDAIIIGIFQMLAIVPGVSRSGSTIVGGLYRGLKREDAARFSFLLAAPVTAGAGFWEFGNILNNFNLNVFLSLISSFVVGLLAINLLLGYVKKNNFTVFVFYRLVLALVLVGFYLYR